MSMSRVVPHTFEMIDCKSLNELLSPLPEDSVFIIYGAGHHGRLVYEYLKYKGKRTEYFCDKDESKRTDLYYTKVVIAPDDPYVSHEDKIIIVSVYKHQQEIKHELVENGVNPSRIICPPFKIVQCDTIIPEDALPESYKNKYELLSDSKMDTQAKMSTTNPPITVNMIVYNVRASYLRRAIESVLSQTFTDFRFLITDNGSTDGSSEIINEYAKLDPRIEVITFNVNLASLQRYGDEKPIYWNRLREISDKITTKYCCSLDSDDYYEPDFLQITYELAEKHNADMVMGCSWLNVEEAPDKYWHMLPIIGTRVYSGDKSTAMAILNHMFMWSPAWGKLMKSHVFTLPWDYDFEMKHKDEIEKAGNVADGYRSFQRMANCKIFVVSDKILHHWTIRGGSVHGSLKIETKPITRKYFYNSYLINLMRDSGLVEETYIPTINDWIFFSIYYPDLEQIDKAKHTHPELTIQTIDGILNTEIPINLKNDKRMGALLDKLHEIKSEALGR